MLLLHHHGMQLVYFLVPSDEIESNNQIKLNFFFRVNQICLSLLPTLETFFIFLPPSLSKFLVPLEKRKSNRIELFYTKYNQRIKYIFRCYIPLNLFSFLLLPFFTLRFLSSQVLLRLEVFVSIIFFFSFAVLTTSV